MTGLTLFRQFPEAVLAGLLVAGVCGLLGVFVILKRVVFIGITLSETAVCGMALAFLLHVHPVVGAMALTLAGVALLACTVMGLRVRFWETLFFVGLGLTISVASKVAGADLVFCYLIAPPAAALLCTRRLGVALAVAFGMAVTLAGMSVSFRFDLPTNQTIIVMAVGLTAVVKLTRQG